MKPNLAARPLLNTRPVWLLVIVAGTLTVVMATLSVRLFLSTERSLSEQLAQRDALLAERTAKEGQARQAIRELERIGWRGLSRRVSAVNTVLLQHQFSWIRLLDDIERVLPIDVRLVRIAPSSKDGEVLLELNGIARTREAWLELIDNLVADDAFADPRPEREETPEAARVAGYQFSLAVRYHGLGAAP